MFIESLVIIAALLIILVILILNTHKKHSHHKITLDCERAPGVKYSQKVLENMFKKMNPPSSQPVYTLFRSVPRDVVTNSEKKYLQQAITWFSNDQLELLDILHVDWMAKDEQSPIVGMVDARTKIKNQPDVIRIIMTWCERELWKVQLANSKGCFLPSEQKQCKIQVGSISNKVIQMPAQKIMKSIMGRNQDFQWDTTGILKTEAATSNEPMINSAWTERPPEIFQNPTLPSPQTKLNLKMFLKDYGVPRS